MDSGAIYLASKESTTCNYNYYQNGGTLVDLDNAVNSLSAGSGYSANFAGGSTALDSGAGYGGSPSIYSNATLGANFTLNMRINNAAGGAGNEDQLNFGTNSTCTIANGASLDVTQTTGTLAKNQTWTLINCANKNISGTFGNNVTKPTGTSLSAYTTVLSLTP